MSARTRERKERMIPAPFEYVRAETLDEAIGALGSYEDAKLLAGGHSLLPAMRLRVARPQHAGRHRTAARPELRP